MVRIFPTMPDKLKSQPEWLERQLVGPDLRQLVEELRALHGIEDSPYDLDAVLAGQAKSVVDRGLRGLSGSQIQKLLRFPDLLFDLQELVLVACSPYWDRLLGATRSTPIPTKFLEKLYAQLPPSQGTVTPARSVRVSSGRAPARWLAGIAAVAVVAIGVWLGFGQPKPQPEWGWNRPDLFSKADTRGDYLLAVAAGAEDWQKLPNATREEYMANLIRLRDGCTRVINDPHSPLPPADRVWLVEKCKLWRDKFDLHNAEVRNLKPWETIRDKTDATVVALLVALRERAAGA